MKKLLFIGCVLGSSLAFAQAPILPPAKRINALDLKSFEAKPGPNEVFVSVETRALQDSFDIERSIDGENWEYLMTVNSSNAASGVVAYGETDYDPMYGISYYRLRQRKLDGALAYSAPIVVDFSYNSENPEHLYLKGADRSNYPEDLPVFVMVRNGAGQEYFSKVVLLKNEDRTLTAFDPQQSIPVGEYVIVATEEDVIYGKQLRIEE